MKVDNFQKQCVPIKSQIRRNIYAQTANDIKQRAVVGDGRLHIVFLPLKVLPFSWAVISRSSRCPCSWVLFSMNFSSCFLWAGVVQNVTSRSGLRSLLPRFSSVCVSSEQWFCDHSHCSELFLRFKLYAFVQNVETLCSAVSV